MSIGMGIAICGVWLFVGCCAISKTVSSSGFLIAIFVAIFVTLTILVTK